MRRVTTMLDGQARRDGRPYAWHHERRRVAQQVRRSVLTTLRLAARRGERPGATCRRLGLSLRTVEAWARERRARRACRWRGRPRKPVERERRQTLLLLLWLLGPTTGLPTLRALLPDVPPCVLLDFKRRYRNVWRRRNHWVIRALRWMRAGAVWALDFAEPPTSIDGTYREMLLVRDLESGKQLLALPCSDETAASVQAALEALIARFGAPLVCKSDNGSAFRARLVKALASRHRILWLYSPPAYPAYNGACEAGAGSIKTRAHHEAARNDRPGHWTCDDVEAARRQANETARPRGHGGPTPNEAWAARVPIHAEERRAFLQTYRAFELEERCATGFAAAQRLDHYEQAAIDRSAIVRALIHHGFLCVRRRRIPLPLSSHKRANIS